MAFVGLEMLHQLYDGYRKVCRVDGRDLLLMQEEGKVLLINNSCPHAGATLVHASCIGGALRCRPAVSRHARVAHSRHLEIECWPIT